MWDLITEKVNPTLDKTRMTWKEVKEKVTNCFKNLKNHSPVD